MMRKGFLIILSIIAFCSLSGKAWAQVGPWQIAQQAAWLHSGGPAVASLLEKSKARGVNPVFVSQVLQNARGLQDRGLPPAPYLLKANEGLAKGVPPGRMANGLRNTKQQTEVAGRLTDYAIAQGVPVDSPEARRRLTQQYQWGLLNKVPPRQLKAATGRFAAQGGKSKDLFKLSKELRGVTKAQGKKDFKDKKTLKEKQPKKPKGPAAKPPKPKSKDKGPGKKEKRGKTVKPSKSGHAKVRAGGNKQYRAPKTKNGNKKGGNYYQAPKKGGGNGGPGPSRKGKNK